MDLIQITPVNISALIFSLVLNKIIVDKVSAKHICDITCNIF